MNGECTRIGGLRALLAVAPIVLHVASAAGQRPPGRCPQPAGIRLLPPPEAAPVLPGDSTAYLACAVDRAAVVHAPTLPEFPRLLAEAQVDGVVRVGFTILATGAIDTAHIEIYRSTLDLFTRTARESIAGWTAEPARLHGRPVPQWIEYDFWFVAACRAPPRLVLTEPLAHRPQTIEICALR